MTCLSSARSVARWSSRTPSSYSVSIITHPSSRVVRSPTTVVVKIERITNVFTTRRAPCELRRCVEAANLWGITNALLRRSARIRRQVLDQRVRSSQTRSASDDRVHPSQADRTGWLGDATRTASACGHARGTDDHEDARLRAPGCHELSCAGRDDDRPFRDDLLFRAEHSFPDVRPLRGGHHPAIARWLARAS